MRAWNLDGIGADAVLLTSELVSNAVLHARPPNPDHDIDLRVTRITSGLRIEVGDQSTAMPLLREATDGGRGLRLVDAISDRWGADATSTGKTVWFELRSRPGNGPGSG